MMTDRPTAPDPQNEVEEDCMRKQEVSLRAVRKPRTVLFPLIVMLLVIVANVVPLTSPEISQNIFRCFIPGAGDERSCRWPAGHTASQLSAGVPPESVFVAQTRLAPYVLLRSLAPNATYEVSPYVLYIWHGSPILLATVADAAEVRTLPPAQARELSDRVDVLLPADREWESVVGNLTYSLALGPAPVLHVLVFHVGKNVYFVDSRLVPPEPGVAGPLPEAREEA